jgi:hypothetical protein
MASLLTYYSGDSSPINIDILHALISSVNLLVFKYMMHMHVHTWWYINI